MSAPVNDAPYRLIHDVAFGDGVVVHAFTNLYGCRIRDETQIGPFVEIQRGSSVGARAVVGADAVVTRYVPAAAVVAGNPARPLADSGPTSGR
jgi:acetyltransferase-like isoleucine patch superfamily enzyme